MSVYLCDFMNVCLLVAVLWAVCPYFYRACEEHGVRERKNADISPSSGHSPGRMNAFLLTKLRGHVVELLFVFAGLVKDHVDEVLGLRLLDVDHRKLGASPGYLYSKRD